MKFILKLDSTWYDGNLQLAKWSDSSRKILRKTFFEFRESILKKLGAYCMNLKGRGGVKGSARLIYRKLTDYPFTARFDIKSFYGSIDHRILTGELKKINMTEKLMDIIKQYIEIPDTRCQYKGIVAGGALSSLLGAVYLNSIDEAMMTLFKRGNIFYLRYSDDIIIMAKTRWKLKNAIKTLYEKADLLKITFHKDQKRFIGKTDKGFDFLGFFFKPGRKITPSEKSIEKFVQRVRQLKEQGADQNRILSYAERYMCYFHSGLKNAVQLEKIISTCCSLNLTIRRISCRTMQVKGRNLLPSLLRWGWRNLAACNYVHG